MVVEYEEPWFVRFLMFWAAWHLCSGFYILVLAPICYRLVLAVRLLSRARYLYHAEHVLEV